jgi:biopolymer transport protein ExbD
MRFLSKTGSADAKPDMTPMIDIVFQLMAFFMLVINITKVDQDELIHLPASELAKPPEAPPQSPITLQLTDEGTVIFGGERTPEGKNPLLWLRRMLLTERQIIEHTPGREVADATIIIRADRNAKAGDVQRLMELCQGPGIRFQKFKLRARQERP